MKNILTILCLLLAVTSCELFEFDNYDGPNAQIEGSFIDSQTGETIQMECVSTRGLINVVELGWNATATQTWNIKYDGTYCNKRIFSGEYALNGEKINCFNFTDTLTIKKGKNHKDYTLTPFCRIEDVDIRYDESLLKFVATFKVHIPDPEKIQTINSVMFCGNTGMHVGTYLNYCSNDKGATSTKVTPDQTITLTIDPHNSSNSEMFKYKRPYYFRIAARAVGTGPDKVKYNTNNLYNFSKTYKISDDLKTVEEVTFD